MSCLKTFALTVWILGSALSARALTWEKSTLDLSVEAGSGDLVAEFPFKNEGAKPVTIQELQASCGCTTPTVESRLVPAGGKGTIKVTYAVGDRVGPQSSHVTVTTDEANTEPATLQLHVNIQPAVSITPRLVHWTKADGLVARVIEIKRLSKATVLVGEPKPAGDAPLTVELKPGAAADTWLLTLTPKSIEASFTTKVEIPITVGERATTYSVFAIVR